MSNFYLVKLISDPLTLRPLCSSRFRLNKKCLADQLLLGQNLLKNVLNRKTFFELTTPNVYPPDDNFNHALFCLIVMSQSLPDIRFAKMPFSSFKIRALLPPALE